MTDPPDRAPQTGSHAESPRRPFVDGKFLRVDGRRFLVKGVTYGTFAPDATGYQFPAPDRIATDFALMAAHGINTVRTYTVPNVALLDEAARHGLKVMVGLPWSQHVAFLDNPRLCRGIRKFLCDQVSALVSHPAALLFTLGNEIPAPIVRWHGRRRIERFLWELYEAVKSVAPEAMTTYVNYPPTEFLDLSFLDVCAFNVFLHRENDMRAYCNRLQTVAGHKPLLLAEAGADGVRESPEGQAEIVGMQIRTAFERGACGAVAFAWTDEWWRGGSLVEDWAFGLVDAARHPKPALYAAEAAFAAAPFPDSERGRWPKVSVAVCAYDAAETIDECLTSIRALTYPDFEILVVNDGSRDATGEIARRHPGVRVIDVPNGGLAVARNVALHYATGEIIAYTDADVRVDPDWLTYLIHPLATSSAAGAGGPNVVPPTDSWMAQCVARAPGGPTHVLLSDRVAEHVPGCNMAFRRDALLAIGGFNPIFVRAGDDVDICWRLQARGSRIVFAPSALVWHHYRGSLRAYWKQQVGYGEGEGWLMAGHPEKFAGGRPMWRGRIYSPLPYVRSLARARINAGVWGTALFPSVYRRDGYSFAYIPHRFRWQILSLGLVGAGMVAFVMSRTTTSVALAGAGVAGLGLTAISCLTFAVRSDLDRLPPIDRLPAGASRFVYVAVIGWLHFVQPVARAFGRLRALQAPGGPPFPKVSRRPAASRLTFRDFIVGLSLLFGVASERRLWSESWVGVETLLTRITDGLRGSRAFRRIAVDDGWHADRDIRVGVPGVGSLDLRAVVEDHGSGRSLVRVGTRLQLGMTAFLVLCGLAMLVMGAAVADPQPGAAVEALVAAAVTLAVFGAASLQTARAVAVLRRVVRDAAGSLGLSPIEDGDRPGPPGDEPVRGETDPPVEAARSDVAGVAFLLASRERQHDTEQV